MSEHTEKTSFNGLAGTIDCVIDWPEHEPQGWALVLHPHPLHGGARDNKIVTTIARACVQRGLAAVRPNFRGVGASEGEFDRAVGETGDMHELIKQFRQRYPQLAQGKWVLAGFSFGTAVAAQLYSGIAEQAGSWSLADGAQPAVTVPGALILVGTAVERFAFRDIAVPQDTLLIHGEVDEVVPLAEAMGFARTRDLPMVVIPDASHFFHGKLIPLRMLVQRHLAGL